MIYAIDIPIKDFSIHSILSSAAPSDIANRNDYSGQRPIHSSPGGVRGAGKPPDWSGNAPDRCMAFFAKLFFTCGITAELSGDSQGDGATSGGAATSPRYPFFCQTFFSPVELPLSLRGIPKGAEPPQAGQHRRPATWLFLPNFFFTCGITAELSGDSQGGGATSGGAATSPRYMAFFAKLFFTWKKSGYCLRSMILPEESR